MKMNFGAHSFETSNDDKPMFPDAGITKADVFAYYRDVSALMLPHLRDRCLTIERYPDGVGEEGFYQQRRGDYFPKFIEGVSLPKADGDEQVNHMVVANTAGLIYLADQGAITFHGWLSTFNAPRHPDRIVFDLDPADEDFGTVIFAARQLREILARLGLEPHVMTSGSRGLHVTAPLDGALDFEDIRSFARNVAAATAERHPARLTVEQRKQKRAGRLYIDTGRNAYGQTAVLPYSLRALPGAPAATPLDWDELGRGDLGPQRFGLGNLRRRLAQKPDPFEDYFRHRRRPAADDEALRGWAQEP